MDLCATRDPRGCGIFQRGHTQTTGEILCSWLSTACHVHDYYDHSNIPNIIRKGISCLIFCVNLCVSLQCTFTVILVFNTQLLPWHHTTIHHGRHLHELRETSLQNGAMPKMPSSNRGRENHKEERRMNRHPLLKPLPFTMAQE